MLKKMITIIYACVFLLGLLTITLTCSLYFYDLPIWANSAITGVCTLIVLSIGYQQQPIHRRLLTLIPLTIGIGALLGIVFLCTRTHIIQGNVSAYRYLKEKQSLLGECKMLVGAVTHIITDDDDAHKNFPNKFQRLCTYGHIFIKGIIPITNAYTLFGKTILIHSWYDFLQMYREIFIYREYEYPITTSEIPIIIDCGSNIGMTILSFKMLYPQAKITCFEPDKTTFSLLKKNISTNTITDITPVQKGVANREGIAYLSTTSIGSSIQDSPGPSGTSITLTRLSSYLTKAIDLLKLDIEGGEMAVIEDLVEHGKLTMCKNIIMEIHYKHELPFFIELFKKNGFNCQVNNNGPLPMLYATQLR